MIPSAQLIMQDHAFCLKNKIQSSIHDYLWVCVVPALHLDLLTRHAVAFRGLRTEDA